MIKKFNITTTRQTELIDITHKVKEVVKKSNIKEGICCIFIPHTTAAVTINENADVSVKDDFLKEVNKVIPFEDNYSHAEGNSAAHIKSSLVGATDIILIENSQLLLGTWQGIYFCEFDGPRTRQVYLRITS